MAALVIRRATWSGKPDGDAWAVWQLRNHPAIRRWMVHTEEIPWETHELWYATFIRDSWRELWVAEQAGEIVGVIRTEGTVCCQVSVMVSPTHQRQGIGRLLVTHLVAHSGLRPFVQHWIARVRPDNEASGALFRTCGWQDAGVHEGMREYRCCAPDHGPPVQECFTTQSCS